MKAAGKKYEPVIYDGAGHGFMRAGQAPDANDANKKACDQGFHRMLAVIEQPLAPPASGARTCPFAPPPSLQRSASAPVVCHDEAQQRQTARHGCNNEDVKT